ncbi:transcriptional repressor [Neiella marina]|uniref:Transcriptional repressor n=1 Tax=Neiella holothuriorum TaxID=2870530 RepID=A0ABS7EBE3_9GAMM|nr:Fur family transcriptional regulator [Neiella holothuriorum]MBW8189655.1 transcriptional repressor [Neiella holothuriorum]
MTMNVERGLASAKQKCHDTGVRFTEKREALLKLLLSASTPLSAYELVDVYNKTNEHSIQAMSVYRILDLFVEMDLVHKLSSSNKYVTCAHLTCDHHHHEQFFLVCKSCGTSREISMSSPLITQIEKSAKEAGFTLLQSQFELNGLCGECQNKSA